ncbi:MAG: glycosyltransferase family 2 protein [Bacteroidales bacterium]
MKSYPKISIVTPSLNQGEFIEETILSVINQGYPNLEYIIIDGGSSDGTIEIIKKYENHLSFWVSEIDRGQSHAINKGIKLATGDIFNWLNSDDRLLPGALSAVAEAFTDPSMPDLVIGDEQEFFMDDVNRIEIYTTTIKRTLEETIYAGHIVQSVTFFRKDVIDKIGLLNENLHYCMDAEWWVRYLLQYGDTKIKKIDQVLTLFRIHNQSKTGTQGKWFGIEKRIIEKSLAIKVGVNRVIIETFYSEKLEHEILFSEIDVCKDIDFKKLRSLFDRDFYYPLFVISNFKGSRNTFIRYLLHYRPKFSFILFLHIIKILLTPSFFVKKIRKIKYKHCSNL